MKMRSMVGVCFIDFEHPACLGIRGLEFVLTEFGKTKKTTDVLSVSDF